MIEISKAKQQKKSSWNNNTINGIQKNGAPYTNVESVYVCSCY